MRGTLGAALRTLLFVGGMVVLFAGIVTYAFPSLGATAMPAIGFEAAPTPGGGPNPIPSIVAIVLGLLSAGTALAVPGRSPFPLVPEQRYTRRQRGSVLVGGLLSLVQPAGLIALVRLGRAPAIWLLPGGLAAIVGALLVLAGTATGLS